MLNYQEFEKEIKEFYSENNLYIDTPRQKIINSRFKYADPSMAYIFTPGVGRYNERTLEISPSDDHPYLITITKEDERKNKTILSSSNPSVRVQTMSSDKDFDYLIMKLEMKKNIGTPSILIYPKGSSKIGKLFGKKDDDFSNPLNEKYKIKISQNQTWFYSCIDDDIKKILLNFEFPKRKGTVFQFSNNAATFSILPRAIGKSELKQALIILDKLAKNIERNCPY